MAKALSRSAVRWFESLPSTVLLPDKGGLGLMTSQVPSEPMLLKYSLLPRSETSFQRGAALFYDFSLPLSLSG